MRISEYITLPSFMVEGCGLLSFPLSDTSAYSTLVLASLSCCEKGKRGGEKEGRKGGKEE